MQQYFLTRNQAGKELNEKISFGGRIIKQMKSIGSLLLLVLMLAFQFVANSAGAQAWKWGVGSLCIKGYGDIDAMGRPLVMGRSGNLYLKGTSRSYSSDTTKYTYGAYTVADSNNSLYQGILVCADSNGHYLWAMGSQNGIIQFNTIAVDSAENIYVGGALQAGYVTLGDKTLRGVPSFVAKINSSGYVLWIKEIAPGLIPTSMVINNTGSLYISGYFYVPTVAVGSTILTNVDHSGSTNDVFYGKFDTSLNPIWVKQFGGMKRDDATALSLTNDSEIYILGSFYSDSITLGTHVIYNHSSLSTYFLAKFDAVGNPLWAKNNPKDTTSAIYDFAVDGNNNAYLVGWNNGYFHFGTDSLSLSDGLILCKYNSAGSEQWLRTATGLTGGYNIVIDRCDNIWICGEHFSRSLPHPEDGFFLAKYDTSGVLHDTLFLNAGGDDFTGLVADNIGNLYLGGDYMQNPMVIVGDTLLYNDSSYESLFLAKYWYNSVMCDSETHTLSVKSPLKSVVPVINIFPNPANETCTLTTNLWFPEGSTVEVYDLTGRVIRRFPIFGSSTSINVAGIMPGMYQCRVNIKDQPQQTFKLSIVD